MSRESIGEAISQSNALTDATVLCFHIYVFHRMTTDSYLIAFLADKILKLNS